MKTINQKNNLKRVLLFLIFFSILTFSQKKEFTYEDIVLNSYGKLAPEKLSQLSWNKEETEFYRVKKDTLFIENVKGTREIFLLEELNSLLEKFNSAGIIRFPRISAFKGNNIFFVLDNSLFKVNVKNKIAEKLFAFPNDAENITLSPDFTKIAFTIKNNLFYVDKNGIKQITDDKNTDFINGQTVSRNEFGINGGIFWSPKSDKIAFYRKDVSNVTDYPILDLSTKPASVNFVKYPMNGMKSEILSIGIFDLKTNETRFLKIEGENEQYLVSLTWAPDEKFFFVGHLNRLQNHLEMKKYSLNTFESVKTLFEENSEKYVEPEHPLYFLDEEKFLWFSERDGWQHLYLYDINGKLIKQVTKGNYEILDVEIIDSNRILISSTEKSPIEKHYFLMNINNGSRVGLTNEHGWHNVFPSYDGNYFIDSFTSTEIPRKINLLNKNGDVIGNLLTSPNPIGNYALGDRKIFTIENDGVKLFCRMILPVNFDEEKKYPVIVYVYGGPHVQLVKDTWAYGRYDFWFYKMAQKGFIVFTLDNRGSSHRGLEFEQATWHRLGTVEIEDQLAGVKYLKSLPYVDSTRFGVFGWSFGGFMTTSLMLRSNNAFKVGVAGGAVIDWRYYEIMYGERYMGTNENNGIGMEEANLLNYVENLNGNLLLVHGTSDDVVVWQHTLLFLQKATHLNKRLDYYPYVGHKHGVYGKDAVNLYEKLSEYFFEHL